MLGKIFDQSEQRVFHNPKSHATCALAYEFHWGWSLTGKVGKYYVFSKSITFITT